MISWLVEQSIYFSCLVVLLSCLRRQLTTRTGATGYYYLWAIVPLQLLLSIFATKLSFENKIVSQSHVFYFSSNIDWTQQVIENTGVFPVYLWAIGCASLVLFVSGQYAFNRINVTHSRELTLDDFSLDECDEPSNLWPKIYLSKSTATPIAYGFIHPVIVVPETFLQLTTKQQQLLIKHELVHLRRGDLYWNLLALATVAVFWFNPIAWLGYRQFRLAQEMSCDAQVLVNEEMVTRQSYAKAFLAHTVSSESELLTTLYYGGKKNMKERLSNIQSGTHKNWKRIPVALAFLLLSAVFQTLAMSENGYDRSGVQPLVRVNPTYPIYAAKNGLEGSVVLRFSIGIDGFVSDIEVVESNPESVFDSSAILALQRWVYTPPDKILKNQSVTMDFMLNN